MKRIATLGCGFLVFLLLLACNLSELIVASAGATRSAAAIILMAAVVPAGLYSFLIIQLDRNEREPARVMLGTFVWGAVVATAVALFLNTLAELAIASVVGPRGADILGSVAVAPFVEESAKGAAVLILFLRLRDEFDGAVDGLVYGSLVGLGFAMTENAVYFFRSYQDGDLVATFYVRAMLMGFGHAAYTGLFGASLGYLRERPSRLRILLVPAGFAGAILFHSAWNAFASVFWPLVGARRSDEVNLFVVGPIGVVLFLGPLFVILWLVLSRALAREERVIVDQLREEVAAGFISDADFRRLSSTGARRRAELEALRRYGYATWQALARYDQALIDMAFRKWHDAGGKMVPKRLRDSGIDDIRKQVVVAAEALRGQGRYRLQQ